MEENNKNKKYNKYIHNKKIKNNCCDKPRDAINK